MFIPVWVIVLICVVLLFRSSEFRALLVLVGVVGGFVMLIGLALLTPVFFNAIKGTALENVVYLAFGVWVVGYVGWDTYKRNRQTQRKPPSEITES